MRQNISGSSVGRMLKRIKLCDGVQHLIVHTVSKIPVSLHVLFVVNAQQFFVSSVDWKIIILVVARWLLIGIAKIYRKVRILSGLRYIPKCAQSVIDQLRSIKGVIT